MKKLINQTLEPLTGGRTLLQSKRLRSLTSVLLTLVLILGLLPAMPLMAAGPAPGEVTINKTSVRVGNTRDYDVTLTVKGEPLETPVKNDIVLVLDQSGSMAWGITGNQNPGAGNRRWDILKAAADNFVNQVLSTELAPHNRIAVVSYSGSSGRNDTAWNDSWERIDFSNNAAAVKNSYGSLSPSGGTNVEAGFLEADETMDGARAAADKYVILLSDGQPTYRYDNSGITVGNGNDYDAQHTADAIGRAQAIKTNHPGTKIFTIGINTDSDATRRSNLLATLNPSGSNKYQDKFFEITTAAGMNAVFAELATLITASTVATDAVVKDYIENGFSFVNFISMDPAASASHGSGIITWNLGSITNTTKTLKFRVHASDPIYGAAFTNDYTDPDSGADLTFTPVSANTKYSGVTTLDFPQPSVPVPPIAVNDAYETTVGATLTINAANGVLKNDKSTDHRQDGGTATSINNSVTVVSGPAHGTLTQNPDGSFTYVADSSYIGDVTYTYQIKTKVVINGVETVLTDTAVVTIHIKGYKLNVEKTSTTTEITAAGQVVPYTFTVTNTGNTTLTEITVVDLLLDAPATYVSGDTNGDDKLQTTETWVYTGSRTVTQAEIDAGGNLTNTVTADSKESAPDTDNHSIPIRKTAALNLTKTGSFNAGANGVADVGELITYNFTIANTGNVTLTGVTLNDPLLGGAITLSATTIPVGGFVTGTATYAVTQANINAGKVDNTATADSNQTGPDTDSETVNLPQNAALNLTKTGSFAAGANGVADVGELITYNFTIANTGNVTLTGVTLNDPLLGGAITLSATTIPVGGSVTGTATYAVTQADINAGKVDNTATADSNQTGPDTDSETVNLPQNAALNLTKTGSFAAGANGVADVGELITYNFTIANTGNVTLTGVTLNDPLLGGAITLSATTIPVGGSVTGTATYAVTQADINAGKVDNTATADSDQTGPDTDSETVNLPQNAALNLTKTGSFDAGADGFADVGELITYNFTIVNTGNVTLIGVTLTDPLLGGAIALSATTIPVGGSVTGTATYPVTQADINAGKVDNTATADSNQTGPDTDSETVNLPQNAALNLTKTGSLDAGEDGYADAGELITYSFTITNTGNVTLTGVTLNDPLLGGAITLSATTIPVGGSVTGTANYVLTQADVDAGKVDNTATADSNQTDPDTDSETVNLPQKPDLTLVKTGSFAAGADGVAQPGELITYSFTVTNTGNVTLTGVTLNDPLLGGAIALSATTIPVGGFVTGTATYPVTQADINAGKVDNTATADSDQTGPDTDSEKVNLPQNAALNLTKTGSFAAGADGVAQPGELITYNFTIANTGNVTLTGVTLNDPLLGGAITLSATTIPVGGSVTGTATYPVTQADINAGKVDNTATADSDQTGPDTDSEKVNLPQNAALNLTKTGSFAAGANGVADVGELITYNFTVANTGNVTLTGVTLNDPLLGGAITLSATTIPVGGSVTGTATYPVTQADINAGKVDNTATADSDQTGPDTDSAKVNLPQNAALNLTKTGSFAAGADGFADVGELITYTFTVTNTGNVTLTGVTVTDPLLSSPITLSATTIPVGGSVTGTATYAVTQADINAGKVYNLATADSEESPPDEDDEETPLPQNPKLALVKTSSFDAGEDGFADVGELITYTFTVANIGNVTLTGVTVTDPLLSSPITLSATTIPVGGSVTGTATYVVTQADIDAGKVYNLATADSEESPPDEDDEETPLPQNPKLALVKTGSFGAGEDGFADVGELITYTFTVTNIGNVTLTGVTVTDPLLSSPITLSATTIPVGGSVTGTATYVVTQADIDAGKVYNLATADSEESPPDEDDEETPLPQNPKLALVKTSSFDAGADGFADVGELITYTFTITNTGNVTLTGVSVTDPLLSSPITLSATTIPVGGSVTGTATYVVTQADIDAGEVYNLATADSEESPPDEDDEETPLPQNPKLALVKTSSFDAGADGFADVGELITYTFTVANIGNVTLTGVTVTDPLLSSPITLSATTIPVGGSVTGTATYVVTQADVDAGKVYNLATADSEESPPDEDDEETPLPQNPELSLVKTGTWIDADDDGFAAVGDLINYTFQVTNTGNVTLTGITVTDPKVPAISLPKTTLLPGETMTGTGSYTVTQADIDVGSVYNLATADSEESDPDDDTEITPLTPIASISIDKQAANLTQDDEYGDFVELEEGETAIYRIVITNTGNVTLENVLLTDSEAAPGTVVIFADESTAAFDAGSSLNLGTLAPKASITLYYTYETEFADIARSPIENEATVTVARYELSESDSAFLNVNEIPLAGDLGLEVEKKVRNKTVNGVLADMVTGYVGDVFEFEVTVTNLSMTAEISEAKLYDSKALIGTKVLRVNDNTELTWVDDGSGRRHARHWHGTCRHNTHIPLPLHRGCG